MKSYSTIRNDIALPTTNHRLRTNFVSSLLLSSAVLVGCGGGGGDSASPSEVSAAESPQPTSTTANQDTSNQTSTVATSTAIGTITQSIDHNVGQFKTIELSVDLSQTLALFSGKYRVVNICDETGQSFYTAIKRSNDSINRTFSVPIAVSVLTIEVYDEQDTPAIKQEIQL